MRMEQPRRAPVSGSTLSFGKFPRDPGEPPTSQLPLSSEPAFGSPKPPELQPSHELPKVPRAASQGPRPQTGSLKLPKSTPPISLEPMTRP